MIARREVLAALSLLAIPGAAHAQSAIKRIGILAAGSRESTRFQFAAFEAGLLELGYVKGKDVALDYIFADGKFERLPSLAAEIVRREPDVLLVQSTPAVVAAK